MRRLALVCLATAVVAGCGDASGPYTTETASTPSRTTPAESRPSGPLVRICDRRLASEIGSLLRSAGFRGHPDIRQHPSGAAGHSSCDLGPVALRMDAATDAPQRYRNRIAETAQFSQGIPSHAPRHIPGVGDRRLGPAGANWLPWIHQLLSARGKRVLIVSVDGGALRDSARLSVAVAISGAVYRRLGVNRSGEA